MKQVIKCRLKVLLAERDLTQKELAEKTGLQPNLISKMNRNVLKHYPIEAIDAICDFLDCEVSDLLIRIKS